MLRTQVTGRQNVEYNACRSRSSNKKNIFREHDNIEKIFQYNLIVVFFNLFFIQFCCYLLTLTVIHSDPAKRPKRVLCMLYLWRFFSAHKKIKNEFKF